MALYRRGNVWWVKIPRAGKSSLRVSTKERATSEKPSPKAKKFEALLVAREGYPSNMNALFERCYSVDDLNIVKAHLAVGGKQYTYAAERAIQRMKAEASLIYLSAKNLHTQAPDEREALEAVMASALELIGCDLKLTAQDGVMPFVNVGERLKYNLDCIRQYQDMVQSLGLFLELATP